MVSLHFFGQQDSMNDPNGKIDRHAPILYDQTSFEEIKR